MKLCARKVVDASMIATMDKDDIKDFVFSSLCREISSEVAKQMTIDEVRDLMNDTITYTGTVTVGQGASGSVYTSPSTISGFNGTSSASPRIHNNVQEILRVVEYTKNGKVTRVELQTFDEISDNWIKIPRIQIEE